MIKELFLAIFFGALIGFGVSGTYYVLKSQKNPQDLPSPTPTLAADISPDPKTPTPSVNFKIDSVQNSLKVSFPQDNSIVNQSNITIKGSFVKESLIIVTTTTNSYQTQTDESGNFSLPISLEGGANHLKITGIGPDFQNDLQIWVAFTTSKIE